MNSNIYREILKSALMYLHRKQLEKGTYVNFQILSKFMKVSFHNIIYIHLSAKVS